MRGLAVAVLLAHALSAHSMDQAAVLLDFRDGVVDAEVQLPVERLQAALGLTLTDRTIESGRARITDYILSGLSASGPHRAWFGTALVEQGRLATIEGSPYLIARVRLTPPAGASADVFDLYCGLLPDPGHAVLVSIRSDWPGGTFASDPQLIAVLGGNSRSVRVDRRGGSWGRGFQGVFQLGMRHIAEGTDHLLFLLALLLPAPLLAAGGRWRKAAGIRRCLWNMSKVVTAFTLGHSITLAAGALDLIRVPTRPVEVLIAISILISAVHALRPIFPGREPLIAGCFGLVHGMAFASTVAALGLGTWERAAAILGFNLGIETMQMLVAAAALPSLILLSRTRLYGALRITGASFAGTAAASWIVERAWGLANPMDVLVTALAHRAVWIAAGLTVLALAARIFPQEEIALDENKDADSRNGWDSRLPVRRAGADGYAAHGFGGKDVSYHAR